MTQFKRWVTGDDLDHDIYGLESEFELEAPMSKNIYNDNHPDNDLMMIDRPSNKRSRRNLRVVDQEHAGMAHAAGAGRQAEVRVIEPMSFEESLEIVEYLRANKSVVLNLHHLDTAQSQRVVDFLSGATHAIDGHQQRIGDGVFIFTPHHVNIASANDERQTEYDTTEPFWK